MSGELEAAGAAATASLVAGALEKGEHKHAAEGPCANCGAALQGAYCHACGQPAHVHHSLWHMIEEALHGLFHFDTKAWRTLPKLALRPGTLTRDYIDGQRARYVSPLALFLFTIFVMFATMAFVGGFSLTDVARVQVNGADIVDPAARENALAELRRERAAAVAAGDLAEVREIDGVIAMVEIGAGAAAAPGEGHSGGLGEAVAEAVRSGAIRIDTGDPTRDAKITERLENPSLLLYKIEQAAYKFAFLLIPISLPFISLLFLWKKGVTLFDHVVFSLYSLSFMSLFLMIMALLSPVTAQWAPADGVRRLAVLLAPPVHLFFHLGGAYKLRLFSAIWRTLVLLMICILSFSIFVTLILMVGLLG